jgi:energy-coupling factor transport system ATP-binding protein
MLTLKNLSFAYPTSEPLFAGLNAQVPAGDVLAVVGKNGAGKSTLLRLLNGLLRPLAGSVSINGKATAGMKVHEIAVAVGTLYQTPEQQLFAAQVREEIAFGPQQLKLDKAAIGRRVDIALERTFLTHQADRHPLDLSSAERRFTALASILAMQPDVLLLDEPQRGLDRIWTERLETIIGEERDAGQAVVLICHDMDFVDRNAQFVLALGTGEQPVAQPTADFFQNRDHVVRACVDPPARQLLDGLRRKLVHAEEIAG